MTKSTTSRQALLDAAATLLQQRGYSATGIKDVAQLGHAPLGSLYHHFPGGKQDLAIAAMLQSGGQMQQALSAAIDPQRDPAAVITAAVTLVRSMLVNSDYRDGCPVTTSILEVANELPAVRDAGMTVYSSWLDTLREKYRRLGLAEADAQLLASTTVSALEGALVLSRAFRTDDHFDQAERALTLVASQLELTPPSHE